jgi:hypothetical protein
MAALTPSTNGVKLPPTWVRLLKFPIFIDPLAAAALPPEELVPEPAVLHADRPTAATAAKAITRIRSEADRRNDLLTLVMWLLRHAEVV